MAQRLAVFSLGFACGMVTALGLGVQAAQRITSEATDSFERAATHAVQQAEAMLQEFVEKHRLSSSRGTDEVPSGPTDIQLLDGMSVCNTSADTSVAGFHKVTCSLWWSVHLGSLAQVWTTTLSAFGTR
jgi:hypothetical protein